MSHLDPLLDRNRRFAASGRYRDLSIMPRHGVFAITSERRRPEGPLFEIAVIHHPDCGTAVLAASDFRRGLAARTGADERALAEKAVTDPDRTVRVDVERVRSCSWIPERVSVSGWVYDLHSGVVRTVVPVAAIPVGARS